MYRFSQILKFLLFLILVSCGFDDDPHSIAGFTNDLCYQRAFDNGHIFRMDGKVWLRGGEDKDDHFDISNWTLQPCQLNFGLGREYFPALIEPNYVNVADHLNDFEFDDPVIVLTSDNEIKVYPIKILQNFELINDIIDSKPVMIAYCKLSNIGAVYRRNYCDKVFTFALSGYSYWDYNILDATNTFLLWDRETESLWLPVINKAVSGQMIGNWLVKYDQSKWMELTWQDVIETYPEALLLDEDQMIEPPVNWPTYLEVNCK